jgi:hypothetical protein
MTSEALIPSVSAVQTTALIVTATAQIYTMLLFASLIRAEE